MLTKTKADVHGGRSTLQDTKCLDDSLGHTVLGLVDVEVAQGAIHNHQNSVIVSIPAIAIEGLPLGLRTPVLVRWDLPDTLISSSSGGPYKARAAHSPESHQRHRFLSEKKQTNHSNNHQHQLQTTPEPNPPKPTIVPVVAKVLLLDRWFQDWRRGNCWPCRLLSDGDAGERAAAANASAERATAGEDLEEREASEAIERTAVREERVAIAGEVTEVGLGP